ncbi:DUF6119 family protein [Chryseolinea lacunae]|uniref:TIGR04141 family sporadically distributed protein n=1 Tax=Chryseolinea lacunae TaxID=2801331 RepID=A0ABS1L1G4_9BACT|nr:TIGR04141 family sporadically distributed protein [Chryseolinea lacunae]
MLFQACVSAKLLKEDPGLRTWIYNTSRRNYNKNILVRRNRELINKDVAYLLVVLKRSTRSLAESLPFFSLLSFNMTIKQIVSLGFPVSIGRIHP